MKIEIHAKIEPCWLNKEITSTNKEFIKNYLLEEIKTKKGTLKLSDDIEIKEFCNEDIKNWLDNHSNIDYEKTKVYLLLKFKFTQEDIRNAVLEKEFEIKDLLKKYLEDKVVNVTSKNDFVIFEPDYKTEISDAVEKYYNEERN